MLYHFSSLDYLKALHRMVSSAVAGKVGPLLMLAKAQGRDAVLTDARWGKRNTAENLANNAWSFLKELQTSLATHISNRGVACMRFGLVLGTQGALPMMLLPIKLGLGGPLGGGAQWLSWIHVDDVIGGIAHLCRMREPGTYNFRAPESLSQAQFSRVAATVLRRPYGFPTPGLPMRLALGEQADLLLEGQRVAPERLTRSGFVFSYPRLEVALRSLA